MIFLSANPAKRRVETLVLLYSPVWMAAIAAVQYSRVLAHWSDAGYLAFGVALAAPIALCALVSRHGARLVALLALLSLIQNYFGASLFFDAFGMEYHFNVRWILHRTPLFLYFLTIAYFATYYVALQIVWRAFRTRFPSLPRAAVIAVRALLCYAVAFGETSAMANEALRDYFSYRNPRAVMLFGSLGYGTVFFVTLPLFYQLDESPSATGKAPPLRRLVSDLLALNMLILIVYELFGAAWVRLIDASSRG